MAKFKQKTTGLKPDEIIVNRIHVVRGQKVMLDFDLAALYGVTTKALNQAVKRNADRFPAEFMFRLTMKEWLNMRSHFVTASTQGTLYQEDVTMRSQIVTASQKRRNAYTTPFAFTEHGVAMVANILKSNKAVKMSILIVKTFILLRKQILDYAELAEQIEALKLHVGKHDSQLKQIFKAIETLLNEQVEELTWKENRNRIGFKQTNHEHKNDI